MTIRRLSKINISELIFTLSVFIIIYITDTMLFATSNIEFFRLVKRGMPLILSVGMVLIHIYKYRRINILDIQVIFVVFSIFISMLLSGRILNGFSYITQMACLVFAVQYSHIVSFERFQEKFIQIMRIIAIFSIIFFLLDRIGVNLSMFPIVTNSVGKMFRFIFLTNIPIFPTLRNWGPFWEPGTYQVYLIVAIYFSLFYSKKDKIKDVILFVITALTTLSGAVLIPMLLIFSAYLFEKKSIKSFFAILGLTILVLILLTTGNFDEMIYKLFRVTPDSTIWYRIGSLVGGIRATMDYPFFGATPEAFDTIRQATIYSYTNSWGAGSSNTFITYYAYYGVFVGTYLLYRLWEFSAMHKKSIISAILIFLSMIATTSNENLSMSLLICVLLFIRSNIKLK